MYMIRRGRTNQAVDIVKALRGTEDAVNVTYKDMVCVCVCVCVFVRVRAAPCTRVTELMNPDTLMHAHAHSVVTPLRTM